MKSKRQTTAAWLTFLGIVSLAAQQASASTIENTIDATGLLEPIAIAYGDHTANSGISPGVDIDGYTFTGTAGDALRVVVTGQSFGFDPVIELRDPLGGILQTQSCGAAFNQTCAINLDQSLSATGNHFLNISDSGNNEAGNYTLHIDRYPPTNNWVGLAYDSPLVTQLGHAGDHDFLAFQGATGTGVRINVTGNSFGLDPNLQIWDPLGNLIFDDLCGAAFNQTCSFLADLNVTESGIYRMGIFDAGFSETGTYSLNVGCTFGACPTVAPIPIPAALPLFASGILGLAGVLRRKKA